MREMKRLIAGLAWPVLASAAFAAPPSPPKALRFRASGPGCGLSNAAFCETFDAPSANQGRAGELDSLKWSAGRMTPEVVFSQEISMPLATLPGHPPLEAQPLCRAGLPDKVFPDQDSLICDPTPNVASPHLMTAVSAHNYGQTSYRIRQPFDFAGRTGKVVFDAEAFVVPQGAPEKTLFGWISIAVTEDPTAVPSFAILTNDEGTVVPRNGFEVHFADNCGGLSSAGAEMRMLNVFQDYRETDLYPGATPCLEAREGKLNHFELRVSQGRIEVYGTPFSPDGTSFASPVLLYAADVNLPFSRGYVTISVHNHASDKYSETNAHGAQRRYDAWIARWDNVGFDGPTAADWREYEVPDSLHPKPDLMAVGYDLPQGADPALSLTFKNVDVSGLRSARLAFSAWYPPERDGGAFGTYLLKYRFNGGAWRDRPVTAAEIARLSEATCQGAIAQVIDLAPAELRAGDNVLELLFTSGKRSGWSPIAANIDLVLLTD